MTNTNKPLFRGKKIDSDGLVKGYYVYDHHREIHVILTAKGNMYEYIIDPSTLEISFDNGETWRSVEEAKQMVGYCDTYGWEGK